jgi:hypothetical protein
VFRSINLELVILEDWPDRPEDQQWIENVAAELESECVDPAHVQRLRELVGVARRVRPEEVAASAGCQPLPVTFAVASSRAAAVIALIPPDPSPR